MWIVQSFSVEVEQTQSLTDIVLPFYRMSLATSDYIAHAASSVSRASDYVPNRFDKNFVFFSSIFVLSFRHYYRFKLLSILFDSFQF